MTNASPLKEEMKLGGAINPKAIAGPEPAVEKYGCLTMLARAGALRTQFVLGIGTDLLGKSYFPAR